MRSLSKSSKVCFLFAVLTIVFIVSYILLGNLYLRTYVWALRTPALTEDVGSVFWISPFYRRRCSCAFTDGCSCRIELKLNGQNGTGTLKMSRVFVTTFPRELHFALAVWEWDGQITNIERVRRSGEVLDIDWQPKQ